jgi:hypothetical protein
MLTAISDLTMWQAGFMVASARNGLMNTSVKAGDGTPFSFHPGCRTASQQNQVAWPAVGVAC